MLSKVKYVIMLIELVDVGPHEAHSASTSSLQEVVETKTKLKVDYDQWQTCNELKGTITAKQKVILFADDVIIYFKNPNSAFPEVQMSNTVLKLHTKY